MKRTAKQFWTGVAACGAAALWFGVAESRGEAILQVFNQSHNEIAARLPEIAEAGYTALWVPPPTKANGGMSVGYDLNDPFDLGNTDLRGTWSTRYGVEADLHNLIELCHRFGMRVYFDNVMNHRSYDIPGYNESTPWNVYPGMCPEDFHVRTTSDGFYRKWDNVRDWNDGWQVMYLGLSDLLDIAHENDIYNADGTGPCNGNFGEHEGDRWHLKPRFVRQAEHPEFYDWMPDGSHCGFGETNGLTTEMILAKPDMYKEDVNAYLIRAVRWLIDRTRVDGLRLDAVKHVPHDFFGEQSYEGSADGSDGGYVGQAQMQFNRTRGFGDWNHRDSVFNSDDPRSDAMMFGEHLGNPPPQEPYVRAGMRLVDDRLRNELNWRFGANDLYGFDYDNSGSDLGWNRGVMHAQSHDNDYVDRKTLHHAFYFMHRGLALVYSDGNNHAATLSGSGGAFPRWAQTDFLGQWGQKQIPTLLHAHENFARYDQKPMGEYAYGNHIAWQRGGGNSESATMLFMLNSQWDYWETTKGAMDFYWSYTDDEGHTHTYDPLLYDYASDMYMPYFCHDDSIQADYAPAHDLAWGNVKFPNNSYAIWSFKNPDPSDLYPSPYPDCFVNDDYRVLAPDSRVITLFEDGHVVEPVMVTRKDGADGDPNFNPYRVADDDPTDYSYRIAIPRVTKGTNVTLQVKADGSAERLLLRLDGGMDFGNHENPDGSGWGHYWEQPYWGAEAGDRADWRDHPPGSCHDFYLGFEEGKDYFNRRIWSEKFAAADTAYCKIGTRGATSYEVSGNGAPTVGENTSTENMASCQAPGFVWHNPATNTVVAVPVETGGPTTEERTFSAKASTDGEGSADGFGDWVVECTDRGNKANFFVHGTVGNTGLTGFTDNAAWGLWAKPYVQGSNPNAQVLRSITHASTLKSVSVDLGMLYDSRLEDSYKGIEFLGPNGEQIFGLNMAGCSNGCPSISYYGAGDVGGEWSAGYGSAVFQVKLTRTATGYRVEGTKRDGGTVSGIAVATDADVATFKAYMNGVEADENTDFRQLYFDNLTYTADVTETPTDEAVAPQFQRNGTGATVWAQTQKEQGARAFLYYTVDGVHWPEGGGGIPANPYTQCVEGNWKLDFLDGDTEKSWWRFDIPEGTFGESRVVRYKIGVFRQMNYGGNGWGTIWPADTTAVAIKRAMMSLWTVEGLNFETQQYHKHNDYTSWTTGFKDGFHLVTARMILDRDQSGLSGGADIANTFRQTFYLDTHVPEGRILYPANDHEDVSGVSYGLVVQTDDTVEKVYYHITDNSTANDGPGNGFNTNGVVEWAEATPSGAWTREMATNTALPKVWKFNYGGIAPESGQEVTIRVRLCEISSSPTNEWSTSDPAEDRPDELHVKELKREVWAHGETKYLYIAWPVADKEMVETGWKVWLRFTGNLVAGDNVQPEDVFSWTSVFINTTTNEEISVTNLGDRVAVEWDPKDFSWPSDWNDGRGECQMAFTMPNVYNGQDDFLYNMTVSIDRNGSAQDSRLIRHKGPLLPTCIITKPPETDSDGAKWVITMEDSVAAREGARELRETPIVVLTDAEATRLDIEFVSPTNYAAGITGTDASWPTNDALRLTDVATTGTTKTWTFAWQVTNAGVYRLNAKVTADNSAGKFSAATNGAFRSATVEFKQLVHSTTNNLDWDDDGISNEDEGKVASRPQGDKEYWKQEDTFRFLTSGRTDSNNPDTDGDGLPDGLELGYRNTVSPSNDYSGTDWQADTDGDGWPNFVWDRDPPFYNSYVSWDPSWVPGVKNSTEGGDREAIVQGTVTDPLNPDSDYDGIPDGVEDANRNGWTDGDGSMLEGYSENQLKNRSWPDGAIDPWETWEETSPCVSDSDGDGLSDGYGEDRNFNGHCDLALLWSEDGDPVPLDPADYAEWGIGVDNQSTANSSFLGEPKPRTSRAIDYDALFEAFCTSNANGNGKKQTNGWPRIIIAETDPLCADTDHDGLPDGWEARYGLDPLNNGIYDFRTGSFTLDNRHGANGNPDGDTLIQNGAVVPFDNAAELFNGTNPNAFDGAAGGGTTPSGSYVIGTGDPIGKVNETMYYTEFTQWTLDDLLALDDYNQGGNSSDIYRNFGDGYESSRDMVAFYFHDGGDSAVGGDDKLYFRVDFDDLQAFAEDGGLNIYVAINLGTYGNGITWLPDDVNCKTEMGWNAVVGVYDSQNGCCYVQKGNTQEYEATGGFQGACFNSQLDTVAWSMDRTLLTKMGWFGDGDNLMFQVYTTKDFTSDSGGSGDKGGLNDFTDVVGGWKDDWLCSDYWNDYNNIAQNGVYRYCISKGNSDKEHTWNHCGHNAKLAMVAHGNQAIEPGSTIQGIVNNGAGAGYGRPVMIHNIYTNCPMNLHITPTLAMALQWAEVDNEETWFSGPELNQSIKDGVASGAISLLGSTYSDHIPPYFPDEFNTANVEMANEVLDEIYGDGEPVVSRDVFWSPERVVDATVLSKVKGMGYRATVIDQTPHLLEWFSQESPQKGREKSLGDDAYKIQRFWLKDTNEEMLAFALSTAANNFRYANTDEGLPTDLRHLFLRRARTGAAAISSIFYMWEDFASTANADAYDKSLRWIANHPWIQVVTLDEALEDPVLTHGDNLSYGDLWATNGMAMQDWVNHACNGSYSNWYYGSWRHRGLAPKFFEIRLNECMTNAYGDAGSGVLHDAWAAVEGIRNADVKRLAEGTIFASAFETAFHKENNGDLSRWSYGEYINPALEPDRDLMSMSWRAQSRTRLAAAYRAVDDWAGRTLTGVEAVSEDVDLDGEPEWILRNNKVMALFEREGGLMVGAWLKEGNHVWQMVGNFTAQPEIGFETHSDGTTRDPGTDELLRMQRGAAMKDLSVGGSSTVATLFTVTAGANSLTFTGGGETKTVSLADANTGAFGITHSAPGKELKVWNGLSPDLETLMVGGQARLSQAGEEGQSVALSTRNGGKVVTATLTMTEGSWAGGGTDKEAEWRTVNMRNAAQVCQVEVYGTGSLGYTLAFESATDLNHPPVLALDPDGDALTAVVGSTATLQATATDEDGDVVTLTAAPLPTVGTSTATFDESTGEFEWVVVPASSGGRKTDLTFDVEFRATDGIETTSRVVRVTVPWDHDGNEIGDDWEFLQVRAVGKLSKEGDEDEDGFSDYAEWVAGTDPNSEGSYVGWTQQYVSNGVLTLVFQSVPGATYQIEGKTPEELTDPEKAWKSLATGVVATGDTTEWIDVDYPTMPSRIYRIKIPFYTQR